MLVSSFQYNSEKKIVLPIERVKNAGTLNYHQSLLQIKGKRQQRKTKW